MSLKKTDQGEEKRRSCMYVEIGFMPESRQVIKYREGQAPERAGHAFLASTKSLISSGSLNDMASVSLWFRVLTFYYLS